MSEDATFEDVLQAAVMGAEPIFSRPAPPDPVDLGRSIVAASADSDDRNAPASDSSALELTPDLRSFVYPEWNRRAERYRERWCRVTELTAASTHSTAVYRQTLRTRRALVAEIGRQFERIAPETLHRIRRVREGEDLDLDACIEAFADLRAGIPPSDAVYQTQHRAQRDVAGVFLLDLSSSTQEIVMSGGRLRRLLDVALESLILLIEPLARVGDVFGMYGFSGIGRRDVRCIVIKDIKERLGDEGMSRLGSLRPHETTRMGAAIRHAVTKLKGHQAGSRLFMLISDGRPFDVDYGQEYGKGEEIEFAVHDTRAALDEARRQGIRPFLLTLDTHGADYLRAMCNGLDYELLGDIAELPTRLASLYQHLTAPVTPPARRR